MLMAKDSGNGMHATQPHTFIMLPSVSVRQASPYLDFKLMNHLSSFTKTPRDCSSEQGAETLSASGYI